MIMTALARYRGDDVAPLGYASKPLGYTLVLWPGADGCRLVPHFGEDGRAPSSYIPNLARTVKAIPFLACDNAAYMLGRTKPTEQESKTQAKHNLFVSLVREFNEHAPDVRAEAYLRWVAGGQPGLASAMEGLDGVAIKRIDMDPIAIAVEGHRGSLHETGPARAFWADRTRSGKAGGLPALCLVCGQTRPTVSTLPQSVIGHLVPGATQANVALASVNFPSASRGASGLGLRSAPICADCAALAVQNFNALAGSADHSWRPPGGGSGLVWWTTDPDADSTVLTVLRPDAESVARLLDAPRSGKGQVWHPKGNEKFFALDFSGNVSRFVVRHWIELPLVRVHDDIVVWFRDVRSPNADRPYFPLFRYAECLGPLQRTQGKWVTPAPDGAVQALVMTALAGQRVPPHYLRLAVTRAAAEVRLTTSDDGLTAGLARRRMEARVGLLRLILNRTVLKEDPMPDHLDENRADPAYLAGRLFAVRADIQRVAMPKVNASIIDKFYDRAMSNPLSVEPGLARLSEQHLRAIRRISEGAYFRLDGLLRELSARRGDAPARLSAAEQAAWICGFDQQRFHEIEAARARAEANAAKKASAQHNHPNPEQD